MSSFPDQEDLAGAANALLRLQDTYALSTSKLAMGDIKGVRDSPQMTGQFARDNTFRQQKQNKELNNIRVSNLGEK